MKPKNPYHFFDTYCLRTPTLPLNDYTQAITKEESAPSFYTDLWKNKTFKEAIYLASPALYDEIEKAIAEINTSKIKQLQKTLLKYYARISSRCTPFGLFAGCSLGHFSNTNTIELSPYKVHNRTTRFDMHFLVAFIQTIIKDDTLKKQLMWFPNTSLYAIGDQYRYIEYIYKNKRRQHSLEAVIKSEHLDIVLNKATKGATIDTLAKAITTTQIDLDEATSFIDLLIENQLLVSELEPNITGADYFTEIQQTFKKLSNTNTWNTVFNQWEQTLTKLDTSLENDSSNYKYLYKDIFTIFEDVDQKYLLQVDLFTKTKQNTLHKKNAYDLLKAMPFLNKINNTKNKNTTLEVFKKAFTRRYETREVPLVLALDTEVGIGYNQQIEAKDDTGFLNDFTIISKQETNHTLQTSKLDTLLFKKIEHLKTTQETSIHLTDTDVLDFPETWTDLPDTISAMVEMVKINNQETLSLSSFGNFSANNLLGRFSAGDSDIKNHTAHIAAVERQINHNKILADIVHLPEARLGNILQRASLNEFEIPYLANSLTKKEHQIDINDIMISIKNNRVVLRSKKHNKEIIPRLYNAHNYRKANSLPIYQFLCEVQVDAKRVNLTFYWSAVFRMHRHLPRVMYKNMILSKAVWRVTSGEHLKNINPDDTASFKQWMDANTIPQWVQLIEGDNTLPLNLINKDCISLLLDHAKKNKVFTLEEFLFTEDTLVKQGDNGFTNQCVISFYNNKKFTEAKQA